MYQTVLKMQNGKNLRASFNYICDIAVSMEGFCSIERNQSKFAKSPKIVIIVSIKLEDRAPLVQVNDYEGFVGDFQ